MYNSIVIFEVKLIGSYTKYLPSGKEIYGVCYHIKANRSGKRIKIWNIAIERVDPIYSPYWLLYNWYVKNRP